MKTEIGLLKKTNTISDDNMEILLVILFKKNNTIIWPSFINYLMEFIHYNSS